MPYNIHSIHSNTDSLCTSSVWSVNLIYQQSWHYIEQTVFLSVFDIATANWMEYLQQTKITNDAQIHDILVSVHVMITKL